MKKIGYALIKKIGKSYKIVLFDSEKKDDLEWSITACDFKDVELVEVYKKDNILYAKKENTFIEV